MHSGTDHEKHRYNADRRKDIGMVGIMKNVTLILIAVVMTLIFIATFSQEAFSTKVAGRFLGYSSPAYSIYYWMIGAFAFGLLMGLFFTLILFIRNKKEIYKLRKTVRQFEKELQEPQDLLRINNAPADPTSAK